MGLFFTDTGAAARGGKPQPRTVKIAALDHRNLGCAQCPRDKAEMQHPKMPPRGAAHPAIYVLGESPTQADDEAGRPFQGAAGETLRGLIPAKWDKLIRWNNILRCRAGREPEPLELACCRGLQERDIAQTKPQAILAFGDAISWALGPDRSTHNWRGRRVPVNIAGHVCWLYPLVHPAALHYNKDKKKDDAIRRCFKRDIERVFADLEAGLPQPAVAGPADYAAGITILKDYGTQGLRQIEGHLAMMLDVDHALDLETNALRPYNADARILSAAIGTFDNTLAFGWRHPQARWSPKHLQIVDGLMGDYLHDPRPVKWAHRAAFEQEWLHKKYGAGVLYRGQWGDTLGQAHVLDERPAKELDELTQLHFGFRVKSLSQLDVKNLENEPLDRVLPYNGMDTKWTHALSQVQADLLVAQDLLHVYADRNQATPALVRTQAKGMVPNPPAVEALDKEFAGKEKTLERQIITNTDAEDFAGKQGKPLNPRSPPQLVAFFRDHLKIPHPNARRGKSASYSCDEDALSKIKHTVAQLIVQSRGLGKMRGYVTPLLPGGKYLHGDGLVHPSYSQYITASGRLSASEPNSQNYPRRKNKELRRVIGCPPGHRFVPFDYGQLEARIVACIADDPVLQAEINNRQDIHGDWTDKIGARFIPKQLKADRKGVRDNIKQYWTFANFYGNVLEAVAYDLSREFEVRIEPRALAPFFDEFWDRYKATRAWQDALTENYNREGWVATATGQRRREPMSRNEYINHPIQGTAGHLVIDAQARIDRIAYEQDIPILTPFLNVHDDLSFYIPEDALEDIIPFIAEQMVCTPFDFITVPLSVEVKVSKGGTWGHNWADLEEIATFETRDFING